MGGQKPRPQHKKFGINAEIDEKNFGKNKFVSDTTKDIGRMFKPDGTDYYGTITLHLYASSSENVINQMSFLSSIVHEKAFSEKMAEAGMQQLVLRVQRHFGHHKPSTLDKSDKRGRFPGEEFKGGN